MSLLYGSRTLRGLLSKVTALKTVGSTSAGRSKSILLRAETLHQTDFAGERVNLVYELTH